jgi:hypothetical protein
VTTRWRRPSGSLHAWAQPLFDALETSGVELVEGGRVPDDIAVAVADVVLVN